MHIANKHTAFVLSAGAGCHRALTGFCQPAVPSHPDLSARRPPLAVFPMRTASSQTCTTRAMPAFRSACPPHVER
eukprot:scaffold5792_cov25-Prasinocladus_malaysianus.AAC.1